MASIGPIASARRFPAALAALRSKQCSTASGHRGEWRSQLFGAAGCAGGGSNRAYVQYCFDLLHLDDRDLQSLPLRKAELAKLMLSPGEPPRDCRRLHVWMPRFMQVALNVSACDRVRSCVRPLNAAWITAGRHGDTRNRRKSTRRAFRSWSLGAFPDPDQTDHLPLPFTTSSHAHLSKAPRRPSFCSGRRTARMPIVLLFRQHGPD
jgi:hypothetical protein